MIKFHRELLRQKEIEINKKNVKFRYCCYKWINAGEFRENLSNNNVWKI